ncbi:SIR2 family NAD-dependent protein deacylase [Bifidobacterium eulemuris]|uniref:Sir2 silent information regulator family NAD-dependent deacetylase n=1 Tax=Bifidobacterium eulemuris TaxID=1765219 RepID=A0A261G9T0_9BIFI|nr:hypothetical protein [Bifidobacterium eulemuris]OZG68164.1 Sir2 silent information regulator family NAD-dependent deacetylase [Bifidobacterium eulemuris]QOL31775.1 Sir2 silent information regulator family NAD-dependent deacetylase [Bifidobacterium eulemuris]
MPFWTHRKQSAQSGETLVAADPLAVSESSETGRDDSSFGEPNADDILAEARELIMGSERVLIGAGSGLSTAAGLTYSGERFTRNFGPWIAKYGISDLYSSSFYPYPTDEERWAYWAKHVDLSRYEPPAMPLYRQLLDGVHDKDYFVLTTNVDAQFAKAGFDPFQIFATQGDYGFMQCMRGCHQRIYPLDDLVPRMLESTVDCAVPSDLVPHCPVCGGQMMVHLRCDQYFVQDEAWYEAQRRYNRFIQQLQERPDVPTVLLELGVGWNTPSIIRFPFEAIAAMLDIPLIRINYDDARIDTADVSQGFEIQDDIAAVLPKLL